MSEQPQPNGSAVADAANREIKVGVMPLFSSWLYICENGPRHLNAALEDLTHRLMQDHRNATSRTNYGGWHYAFDVFKLDEPVIAELRAEMEEHVQGFLNYFRPEARRKKDRFRIEGWINVNRAGEVANRLEDSIFSMSANMSRAWPLGRNFRAQLTALVSGEKFRVYNGLGRFSGGGQAEVQYRTSGAFDATTFAVVGRGLYEQYESHYRTGPRYFVGFNARRALTDRGLTTTASIVPGSNRASFVDRVLHAARAGMTPYLLLPVGDPRREEILTNLRRVYGVELVADIPPEQAIDWFVAASFHRGVHMQLHRIHVPAAFLQPTRRRKRR